MLVAWCRVCVCAYVGMWVCGYVRAGEQMFTEKKRGKETQTLASGRLFPSAILCLLAHTKSLQVIFFFGRRTNLL